MKVKLDEGAKMPVRVHDTDAGLDLYALESGSLPAHGYRTFRTGVHIELPHCCCGLLVSRSGLNSKCGITSTGLIDEGYKGEILVTLHNHSSWPYLVAHGDKISQLVILPVRYVTLEQVDDIPGGTRGNNGFGSSGR